MGGKLTKFVEKHFRKKSKHAQQVQTREVEESELCRIFLEIQEPSVDPQGLLDVEPAALDVLGKVCDTAVEVEDRDTKANDSERVKRSSLPEDSEVILAQPAVASQEENSVPALDQEVTSGQQVHVRRVRPKAARGPRAMPRSSVSSGQQTLSSSRHIDEIPSLGLSSASCSLLDKRFRPKAAKGCRTPMFVSATGVEAISRQLNFTYSEAAATRVRQDRGGDLQMTDQERALEICIMYSA